MALVPKHNAMNVYRRWRKSPRILTLSATEMVLNFTLRPLYHRGKSPGYQMDRKLGQIQSQSGHIGGEKQNPTLSRTTEGRKMFTNVPYKGKNKTNCHNEIA
jgi:hypothetical protein